MQLEDLMFFQLLNFFQDAAHRHADGLGFGQAQLVEQDLFWVLSRLTMEIIDLPQQGDELILSTWVRSIRGSISEREFSISCKNRVLVNSSSLWFCISGQSHKPSRLPEAYVSKMIIKNDYATTSGTMKLAVPEIELERSEGNLVSAQHSDIDMVDHVNNATYARWLVDELPDNFHQQMRIKQLTINYLDEVFKGDELMVRHGEQVNRSLLHEIINVKTNKLICLANSIWRKQ